MTQSHLTLGDPSKICKSRATRAAPSTPQAGAQHHSHVLVVVNYTTKSTFALHVVRCKAMVKNGSNPNPNKIISCGGRREVRPAPPPSNNYFSFVLLLR